MRTTQSPKSSALESRPAREGSPNERRRKSAQAFLLRVVLLMALIVSVAYGAWFAPWARPIHTLKVETVRPTETSTPNQDTGKVETVKPEAEQPGTGKTEAGNKETGTREAGNKAAVQTRETKKIDTKRPDADQPVDTGN